jgi:UDP-N-acetylglucosamine--N-acetylmuramyl-(pentapeptide) pyrophosphoryl-undecaprenol N-acetylglucosamine transferase
MWQTGRIYFEKAFAFINENHLENVKTRAFIERMDLAYAAADIIISRAGAIAISELCIIGKPTILVPYPYAAANHQMHNARRLEAAGAAIIIKDDELPLALPFTLEKLLDDTHWQENLSTQIRKWSIPDADERIAREIIQMVENSKPAKP